MQHLLIKIERYSLMILKNVQNAMVSMTKAQFHSWSSWMVATPKNMKMIVSLEPLNIFIAYFSVV